jgi:RimJ/RimL family protein N-acetyltransferase
MLIGQSIVNTLRSRGKFNALCVLLTRHTTHLASHLYEVKLPPYLPPRPDTYKVHPSTIMADSETKYTPEGTAYIPLQTNSPEQIYVTPLFKSDAHRMTEVMNNDSIGLALIAPPYPYLLADAEWWINETFNGRVDLTLCALRAGSPGPEGKYIGGCGLAPQEQSGFYHLPGRKPDGWEGEPGTRNVAIGYFIHPEYQGRGIVRSAVRAVVNWGRRECGVQDATIWVADGNLASRKVVEGMSEFVASPEEKWEKWPESKGGERRRCASWVWKA